ncbi:DUF6907 domain-containing protein [Streptomyces sp. NPDC058107]|uniref:DUF6907 domain-containing protein n=1 Tax=Streptomyces sp. NPDC058107 TaxID=3346343 RepID=UPI0036E127FC
MQNTVPASFKPSGGIVAQRSIEPRTFEPTEPQLPACVECGSQAGPFRPTGDRYPSGAQKFACSDGCAPAPAEDRTIAYPLRGGGILVEACPSWCVKDHADEIEHGIYAADLTHEGEEVSLGFTTTEGERDVVLAARITQWPHSDADGSEAPHMALLPVAGSGETLGYLTPDQVDTEIRRVEKHLQALRALNEQLVEARAADWDKHSAALETLTTSDIEGMPIPALLQAFGLSVIEVGEMPHEVQGFLDRTGEKPVVYLLRSLPQSARADVVRKLLVSIVEGQA